MIRRRVLAGLCLAALAALAACDQKPALQAAQAKEINFSILSAENEASMRPMWQPLIDDMSAQIGVPVKPFFATNYTSLIEAMRFNQVQAGWFSALPALEATRRANAEVLGRVVMPGGTDTYESVMIVRKGSGITLEDVVKCDKRLTFGIGDVKSTSGTLAPMTYVFTPRDIEPAKCFKAVRPANHQANFLGVANGVLDVATNNSVGLIFAARQSPRLAREIEVIWRSPPLPESSIVVRKDLDPVVREKIRQFLLTYGQGTGPEADRQREVLKGLEYAGFRAADDSYLDPVREMEASETLAKARRGGDPAKIAAAQKAFDQTHAKAGQRRAINPDL